MTIPTDDVFFSKTEEGKPDVEFLKDHFFRLLPFIDQGHRSAVFTLPLDSENLVSKLFLPPP